MKPNPGTSEALDLGCTCPVLDNNYGEGIVLNGQRTWWRNLECPLHIGQKTVRAEEVSVGDFILGEDAVVEEISATTIGLLRFSMQQGTKTVCFSPEEEVIITTQG